MHCFRESELVSSPLAYLVSMAFTSKSVPCVLSAFFLPVRDSTFLAREVPERRTSDGTLQIANLTNKESHRGRQTRLSGRRRLECRHERLLPLDV
jgi:hypothetical protein